MREPAWRKTGTTPDYRFSLANERTFLAWIRTALGLLAGGVAVRQLVQPFEITGTLETAVSLAGPHGTAQIRADDELWDLVFAPSSRTASAGLTEDVIPLGDTVTASGHRHLDESTLEVKTERLTWNGKMFNIYPDRD